MPENVLVFGFFFLLVWVTIICLYFVTWTDLWRIVALKADQMMAPGHFMKHTGVLQQTATPTRLAVLNSNNLKNAANVKLWS